MRLKDRVAIVTGGGSGLGEAGCRKFANEGAIVVVADFNEDAAKRVAQSIVAEGGQAIGLKVNVAERETVDKMVEEVISRFGKIDVLINNAGITKDASFLKMTQKDWQDVIDVNLTGVFNCSQAVLPYMKEAGYGRIVNTSSISRDGIFGQGNYSATKAGVVGLTQVLAKEFGKSGITVNAVAPGFIETPMTAAMKKEAFDAQVSKVPAKRAGKPEDIANAYLVLSEDAASYINGTVLRVDGGLTV